MFLTLGLFIMPPNKVEVEPCFVVAALISRADAKSFMRNGERRREAELCSADQNQEV